MDHVHDIDCVALLRDGVRRSLYFHVRSAGHPVGREEAAAAVGISRGLAAFHLDRLADAGLLEIEFRRLTGRTGRGAGRPAKLYRPGQRRVRVDFPATRYELAGELLIEALEAKRPGDSAEDAARHAARSYGRSVAESVRGTSRGVPMTRMRRALEDLGFEPERQAGELWLRNCPFHELAARHTELICALNHAFIQGLSDGLAGIGLAAELRPQAGYCCVVVRKS